MNQISAILQLYFPTDISQMILQMVYESEHNDAYVDVLHELKMDVLSRLHRSLQEQIIEHSTLQEYTVNNVVITQLQPHVNINTFIINVISEYGSIHETLKILSQCKCCTRHMQKKPNHIHADSNTYQISLEEKQNLAFHNEHKYKHVKHGKSYYCYCPCRRMARLILVAHNNLIHINSLYYRSILLYKYLVSKTLVDYHTDILKTIKNDTRTKRRRKRTTYKHMKYHQERLRIAQENLTYDIAFLQYHITFFPQIIREPKHKALYDDIPINNVHIRMHE